MKRSLTLTLFSMLGTAALFSACKTDPVAVPEVTYVSLTNASPSVATYNVYFDAARFVNGAVPFEGNIPYQAVNPKTYSVKLTSENSAESKLTKQLSFSANKGYSLFIIGRPAELELLALDDEFTPPAADKASIRFVNLSPDAPALDLFEKDKTTLISDKAYKAASAFIQVEPRKYIFELKDKATGQVKGTMAEMELKKGTVYTLIAKGLLTPAATEKPFGGQLIAN